MSATAKQPPAVLEGDHWIESLRDGTRVLVRPLQPKDRAMEEEFIRRLSPEARRFRFLGDFKEPGKALLDHLMHVDYVHDMAFVAMAHDNGQLREVGISRYATTGDSKQCECAITVADDWRNRGLAVLLMRHLIDVARKQKLTRMFSIDDVNNEPMRELAKYLGFTHEAHPEDPRSVVYSLAL
ncbi:GNAT family N-acetyltransferase [Rhodanobacter sp. B04]|uniref:GNAT family N-acetyltransferase n=1 Tax=Rhodanobacter sp. B04 TaxID=1945860 RepID=UPI0009861C7D|nr:GNAT family N-acetyltransferase [Rhodanobacter sp. B04]OOG63465.1 GNAT family N-acetyltransferase [Rhodanobacter sp. B04]